MAKFDQRINSRTSKTDRLVAIATTLIELSSSAGPAPPSAVPTPMPGPVLTLPVFSPPEVCALASAVIAPAEAFSSAIDVDGKMGTRIKEKSKIAMPTFAFHS